MEKFSHHQQRENYHKHRDGNLVIFFKFEFYLNFLFLYNFPVNFPSSSHIKYKL